MDRHQTLNVHSERTTNHYDLAAEIAKMRHGRDWERTGHNAKTLSKEPHLRIVLTALRQGETVREQMIEERISIQTVTGKMRLHLPGKTFNLPPQHLIVVEPGVKYTLEALEDSAYLLSVSWSGVLVAPEPAPKIETTEYAVSPTRPWKRL